MTVFPIYMFHHFYFRHSAINLAYFTLLSDLSLLMLLLLLLRYCSSYRMQCILFDSNKMLKKKLFASHHFFIFISFFFPFCSRGCSHDAHQKIKCGSLKLKASYEFALQFKPLTLPLFLLFIIRIFILFFFFFAFFFSPLLAQWQIARKCKSAK